MNSTMNDVAFEFLPYFRGYKDGRVERFFGTDRVEPSPGSATGVSSKDVLISAETGVSARLFKPSRVDRRLPLLIYFHGGAFCFGSPFCAVYHNHLATLAGEANVVALSVDYRLAPEHYVPAAYEDAWAALRWVASHSKGQGPESWLNDYADLQRVFVAGDSAGANISHNTVARAGEEGLVGVKLVGTCLVHPDFANKEGQPMEVWYFACPETRGSGDPRMNPAVDKRLPGLGCRRVLIFTAGEDLMKDRGWFYYETLKKSGWDGKAEIVETPGEDHVFHLFDPTRESAVDLVKMFASFVNLEGQ